MTVTLFEEPDTTTSPFDRVRREDAVGEYWTARDLLELMDYGQWVKFDAVVMKAKKSLALVQSNAAADEAFALVSQVTQAGNLGNQERRDYRLTRFGAYLTAMAGDDTKEAVAHARVYFAVKTREAETGTSLGELDVRNPAHLMELARVTESLAKRVMELEPDATAWKVLASAEGDYSVREAAYILNRDATLSTGEKRLFSTIRDLMMVDYYDRPYAQFQKHLTLRPYGRKDWVWDETESVYHQLRVTPAGLKYLHRVLGGTDKSILDEYVR